MTSNRLVSKVAILDLKRCGRNLRPHGLRQVVTIRDHLRPSLRCQFGTLDDLAFFESQTFQVLAAGGFLIVSRRVVEWDSCP